MKLNIVDESKAVLEEIRLPGNNTNVKVYLKRLDLIHPYITGNKWYKLKYNLLYAESERYDTILTFGGAYSNHIYSTAAACSHLGFKSIGIIRGEKYSPLNATLSFAESRGMKLCYKDRQTFRRIHTGEYFDEIRKEFGNVYLLPEGGTNEFAVKGCAEICGLIGKDHDYLCTPCGTGGTLSGLIAGSAETVKILGFPVLKGGEFLYSDVKKLLYKTTRKAYSNWKLIPDYHFGGYAGIDTVLLKFKEEFEQLNNILLDFIYTVKMLYGISDLITKGYFPSGSTIVALHTGGLQGNSGMQTKVRKLLGNS